MVVIGLVPAVMGINDFSSPVGRILQVSPPPAPDDPPPELSSATAPETLATAL